jgi:hypothetical protein
MRPLSARFVTMMLEATAGGAFATAGEDGLTHSNLIQTAGTSWLF